MRQCTQCGKCCLKYSAGAGLGSATERDLLIWESERPEILKYTDFLGDLWISPITGEEMVRCPWLRKLPKKERYKCRIHDVRPEICRGYPVDIDQMISDGCEMLEDSDLDKSRNQLLAELQRLRNASESWLHHQVRIFSTDLGSYWVVCATSFFDPVECGQGAWIVFTHLLQPARYSKLLPSKPAITRFWVSFSSLHTFQYFL